MAEARLRSSPSKLSAARDFPSAPDLRTDLGSGDSEADYAATFVSALQAPRRPTDNIHQPTTFVLPSPGPAPAVAAAATTVVAPPPRRLSTVVPSMSADFSTSPLQDLLRTATRSQSPAPVQQLSASLPVPPEPHEDVAKGNTSFNGPAGTPQPVLAWATTSPSPDTYSQTPSSRHYQSESVAATPSSGSAVGRTTRIPRAAAPAAGERRLPVTPGSSGQQQSKPMRRMSLQSLDVNQLR